jgi:hypothetical protein
MENHIAEWRMKKGPANEVVLKECATMPSDEPDFIKQILADLEEKLPASE